MFAQHRSQSVAPQVTGNGFFQLVHFHLPLGDFVHRLPDLGEPDRVAIERIAVGSDDDVEVDVVVAEIRLVTRTGRFGDDLSPVNRELDIEQRRQRTAVALLGTALAMDLDVWQWTIAGERSGGE